MAESASDGFRTPLPSSLPPLFMTGSPAGMPGTRAAVRVPGLLGSGADEVGVR